MPSAALECASRIERVTVYARGAQVTRRVTLPTPLPYDAVEIVIPGVTVLAEAGSARVIVDGGREVVALRARFAAPRGPAGPGAPIERIRALELERESLEHETGELRTRRDLLASLPLQPRLEPRWSRLDPAQRARDALAVSALLTEKVASLDARLHELETRLERNQRALDAERLAASQAPSADLAGEGRPTLEFVVRLAAGDAQVRSLDLEYAVFPARWWPAYTARLANGGARARWAIEALLAQDSGEDWTGVALSLSTADLVHDARLPELASLRLGRAQPSRKKGYRPLPEGLDGMFEGFDRAAAAVPVAPYSPKGGKVKPAPAEKSRRRDATVVSLRESDARRDEPATAIFFAAADAEPVDLSEGGYVMAGPPPPPAPKAMPASAPMASAPAGMPKPADRMRAGAANATLVGGGGASFGALDKGEAVPEPLPPSAIEPGENWLDFDGLVLSDPGQRGRRGRIGRDDRPSFASQAHVARATIDALADPLHAQDPLRTRGQFDHRYDAEGTADVPSDALPHRVTLAAADANAAPRFRTVPREADEVYRETEIRNPFDAPLLAGPVEVFMDGALLTTSAIAAVDRGGSILLGLGIEDRLRVARNVRAQEKGAGLLGGSTAVEHEVAIDLTSALGQAVTVEVIDRVPVSDDKEVAIEAPGGKPPGEAYDQAERGMPIRGGRRWRVPVPAGGKARIEFGYTITLPAKSEIVGGNRRD